MEVADFSQDEQIRLPLRRFDYGRPEIRSSAPTVCQQRSKFFPRQFN
jgi:hypothetical protein